ncbi:MAG TPA: hypothetical protein PLD25_26990 [Chloroflexota bacterium]|nr:hypothetical protein [Chloroflexota bacterium]HUM67251.1 hypothetical protein [Chloroflexota bacterium]
MALFVAVDRAGYFATIRPDSRFYRSFGAAAHFTAYLLGYLRLAHG